MDAWLFVHTTYNNIFYVNVKLHWPTKKSGELSTFLQLIWGNCVPMNLKITVVSLYQFKFLCYVDFKKYDFVPFSVDLC